MPSGIHSNHVRGSAHPRWNNDRIIDKDGYVLIRVGTSHPLADPRGYAGEHVIVAASILGIKAVMGKIVHHINGDRSDNRFENLAIKTRSGHSAYHAQSQQRDNLGRFIQKGEYAHV